MKTVTLTTFGFKYPVGEAGGMPRGAGIADGIFDYRNLINPHSVRALRDWTGTRESVQAYVASDPNFEGEMQNLLTKIDAAVDGKTFFIGCRGGRHRSVAMAEMAKARGVSGTTIITRHLALEFLGLT